MKQQKIPDLPFIKIQFQYIKAGVIKVISILFSKKEPNQPQIYQTHHQHPFMSSEHPQATATAQFPTAPHLSQAQSTKTPTHFTIQQQNQNNKQPIKQKVGKHRQVEKKSQDKRSRRISKQGRKVKSLEEEYRELEEELREVKELVRIQVEMIGSGVAEINQINNSINEANSNNNEVGEQIIINTPVSITKVPLSQLTLSTSPLQTCLQHLFSHHSTIQTANSNYLLLSQVNKQQQSQQTFQIHNLQQRIRQLRFLLNGKQDLLAYEIATFEGMESVQQENVRKIVIDYHLPRRESLGNKNNMEGEFRFVERVVTEMVKLRKSVRQFERELSGIYGDNDDKASHCRDDDTIKQNGQNLPYGNRSNRQDGYNIEQLTTPTKTTRNSSPNNQKMLTQCQNTLLSAQTTRPTQKSPISTPKLLPNQPQLTLLPLSIQNYRHSLIYRVGKLQAVEHQHTIKLKEKYDQLKRQLEQEQVVKKRLVKDYELKRDVYEYKRQVVMGRGNLSTQQKQTESFLSNFLQELQQDDRIVAKIETVQENVKHISCSHLYQDTQHEQIIFQPQIPCSDPVQKYEAPSPEIIKSSSNPSIIDLESSSTSSSNHSKPISTQKHPIFHELTNSHTTPNKKLHLSPFLKLKSSKSKGKNFSHQDEITVKTPVKQKILCQDNDKENTPQKIQFDLKADRLLSKNQELNLQIEGSQVTKEHQQRAMSPQKRQEHTETRKGKSTLRKRRQNAKVNKNEKHTTNRFSYDPKPIQNT